MRKTNSKLSSRMRQTACADRNYMTHCVVELLIFFSSALTEFHEAALGRQISDALVAELFDIHGYPTGYPHPLSLYLLRTRGMRLFNRWPQQWRPDQSTWVCVAFGRIDAARVLRTQLGRLSRCRWLVGVSRRGNRFMPSRRSSLFRCGER